MITACPLLDLNLCKRTVSSLPLQGFGMEKDLIRLLGFDSRLIPVVSFVMCERRHLTCSAPFTGAEVYV